MAAILGLADNVVEEVCAGIDAVVVAANYNWPGQIVISGSIEGIDLACQKLTEAGAKRALKLNVGGAFHSPLLEPASIELQEAIRQESWPLADPMRIRVALHTGEVEFRDGDYFGRAVNRAARLRSLAHQTDSMSMKSLLAGPMRGKATYSTAMPSLLYWAISWCMRRQ